METTHESPARIYILVPARVRTGGPEALHQLGRALRDLGHDASMVYLTQARSWSRRDDTIELPTIDDPMPGEYAPYAVPHVWRIEDSPRNILVFPEVWVDLLAMGESIQRFVWWLSIDHAFPAIRQAGGIAAIAARPARHLAQSHYAIEWLDRRGIPALPLYDYINPRHLAEPVPAGPRTKEVLYPTRGNRYARVLKLFAPDIAWRQIHGLTQAETVALFRRATLYVDFGHHPGKDRMPREAAVGGCCVVTGRRGAAGNPFDIPIPRRFKRRDFAPFAILSILRLIRAVLADPPAASAQLADYRRIIATERDEFMLQVRRIFGEAQPS